MAGKGTQIQNDVTVIVSHVNILVCCAFLLAGVCKMSIMILKVYFMILTYVTLWQMNCKLKSLKKMYKASHETEPFMCVVEKLKQQI